MVFGFGVLSRIRRSTDTVCYAPSRAKLLDPSVGSYKLIQPKDELPVIHKSAVLTEEHERNTVYPSFDYQTKKPSEEVVNIPIELSKRSPIEIIVIAPPEDDGDAEVEVEHKSQELPLLPVEPCKPIEANDEPKGTDRRQDDDSGGIKVDQLDPEDDASSEEEVETVMELPETTRWWETVPTLEGFMKAREKLLKILPEDHELRSLNTLIQDQKNPIEFIRDFFGAVPAMSEDPKGTDDEDIADGEDETVEQLMDEVLRRSELLVQELETARTDLAAAMADNELHGKDVLKLLPDPLSARFASHNTEVFHISSLMTALSARLARTYDEELITQKDQMEELMKKRTKLKEQLQEARSLKENIDSRTSILATKIFDVLDPSQYRDYRLFMAIKPRLIIRSRHLHYRIEYEKERLIELKKSLKQ